MLDPEPKNMYHCHPYHVLKIYKPPVNEPIGSYQIQHLNMSRLVHFRANPLGGCGPLWSAGDPTHLACDNIHV